MIENPSYPRSSYSATYRLPKIKKIDFGFNLFVDQNLLSEPEPVLSLDQGREINLNIFTAFSVQSYGDILDISSFHDIAHGLSCDAKIFRANEIEKWLAMQFLR